MTPRNAADLDKVEFRKWVANATSEQIEETFNHMSYRSRRQHWEIARNQLTFLRHQETLRTHWTITPTFWVVLLAMIFAGIAAIPIIQSWFQGYLTEDKPSFDQNLQSGDSLPQNRQQKTKGHNKSR